MYCQVRFHEHLSEDLKEDDIELPQPIPPSDDCEEKNYIWQLEVGRVSRTYLSEHPSVADICLHNATS